MHFTEWDAHGQDPSLHSSEALLCCGGAAQTYLSWVLTSWLRRCWKSPARKPCVRICWSGACGCRVKQSFGWAQPGSGRSGPMWSLKPDATRRQALSVWCETHVRAGSAYQVNLKVASSGYRLWSCFALRMPQDQTARSLDCKRV